MGTNKEIVRQAIIRVLRPSLLQRHAIPILVISILSVTVSIEVILTNGLILTRDPDYPLFLERFINYNFYPTWNPYGSCSAFETYSMMRIPFLAPFLLFAVIVHLPVDTLVKILLVARIFLSGLSMYFASYILLGFFNRETSGDYKVKMASIIAAFIYMLNPWFISRIGLFIETYIMAPPALALLMKASKTQKTRYIFYAMGLFLLTATCPRLTMIYMSIFTLWFIFSTIIHATKKDKEGVLFNLKGLAFMFIAFLSFGAWWILPALSATFLGGRLAQPALLPSITYEYITWQSSNAGFKNSIRLISDHWPRVSYTPSQLGIELTAWEPISFVLPIAFFIALLLRPKHPSSIFLLLTWLVSTGFSMGTNNPLIAWVFPCILTKLYSFSRIFITPYEWNGVTAMCYAFAVGSFTHYVLTFSTQVGSPSISLKKAILKKTIRGAIIFSLLFSFAVYAFPAAYSALTYVYVPVEIPSEYYEANEWLASLPGDFKVLWFTAPAYLYGTPVSEVHCVTRYKWDVRAPSDHFDVLSSLRPNMGPWTDYTNRFLRYVYNGFCEYDISPLLSSIGVRYLIYHDDILGADEKMQSDLTGLYSQPNLSPVWHKGYIHIFENREYLGESWFFIPNKVFLVFGGLDALSSIFALRDTTPLNTSIIFLEQLSQATMLLEEGLGTHVGFVNKELIDTLLSLAVLGYIPDERIITLFDKTYHGDIYKYWSRIRVYDDWSFWRILEPNYNGYWDWDYGLGCVITMASSAVLQATFTIQEEATYDVWVRYLTLPTGGEFSITIDGIPVGSVFSSGHQGFTWAHVGRVTLRQGQHTLALKNEFGLSCVNLILLLEEEELSLLLEELRRIITNRLVTYLFEGEKLWLPNAGSPEMLTTLFENIGPLLENKNFELIEDGKPRNWRLLLWAGPEKAVRFFVDNQNVFEGKYSVGIESLSRSVVASYTYEYIVPKEEIAQSNTEIVFHVSVKVKTSEDFKTYKPPSERGGACLCVSLLRRDGWFKDITSSVRRYTNWTTLELYTIAPGDVDLIRLDLMLCNCTGTVWFDDVIVEAYVRQVDMRASGGRMLQLPDRTSMYIPIEVIKGGTYELGARASGNGQLNISIGLSTFSVNIDSDSPRWHSIGYIPLSPGTYNLTLTVNGTINLDLLSLQEREESKEIGEVVSYTRKGPTYFFVHIKAENPCILVFTEAYYPGWSAEVTGRALPHLLINGAINGFFINTKGELTLIVKYIPQQFLDIGIIISVISLALFICIDVHIYQRSVRLISKLSLRGKKREL